MQWSSFTTKEGNSVELMDREALEFLKEGINELLNNGGPGDSVECPMIDEDGASKKIFLFAPDKEK